MIRLEQRIIPPEDFNEIFSEGFGEYNGELPQSLFIIFDDEKRVAFCSVYVHSKGNLYLQYIAPAKDTESGKKYKYYIETLNALHGLGFPYIMGAIDNGNKIALMWALRSGFKIIGTRLATNGILYIEVLRKMEVI